MPYLGGKADPHRGLPGANPAGRLEGHYAARRNGDELPDPPRRPDLRPVGSVGPHRHLSRPALLTHRAHPGGAAPWLDDLPIVIRFQQQLTVTVSEDRD